jgi:hypothetical protein
MAAEENAFVENSMGALILLLGLTCLVAPH